jgi:hypothetical protein
MGPFSKNLSLSNFCKIKNIYNIPLAVFEEQLQNLALVNPKHRVGSVDILITLLKMKVRKEVLFFFISEFTQNTVD